MFIHSFQEGTNLEIKRDFTLRERLILNIFKVSSKQMVRQMSLRYNPDEGEIPKQIALEPKITNQVKQFVHNIFFDGYERICQKFIGSVLCASSEISFAFLANNENVVFCCCCFHVRQNL